MFLGKLLSCPHLLPFRLRGGGHVGFDGIKPPVGRAALAPGGNVNLAGDGSGDEGGAKLVEAVD